MVNVSVGFSCVLGASIDRLAMHDEALLDKPKPSSRFIGNMNYFYVGCILHTHALNVDMYLASTCLPVTSMRPRRAMNVSRPQQRKIPDEK